MSLPLLPTTGVGSFPKPSYVTGAHGDLDQNSRCATRNFIRNQDLLGIDVLVDGEFYRGDMATDYCRALGLPLAGWTRSYGNRFWKKGIVDRPLEKKDPLQLEKFAYAQSFTQKPVKAMLTGPTTLANWDFDSYYKNREELVFAWAEIIKHEAHMLEESEAKYIQIDEPAVVERPDEIDLCTEGLRRVVAGLKRAYLITHICYGKYTQIYSWMKTAPVHQIDIELSADLDLGTERSSVLTLMKDDPLTHYKDVAVGVIDIRWGIPTETVDTVVKRIYTALTVLAPSDDLLKKIWIKPDCGFRATKNPIIAYEKMQVMMDAVKKVRAEIEPKT